MLAAGSSLLVFPRSTTQMWMRYGVYQQCKGVVLSLLFYNCFCFFRCKGCRNQVGFDRHLKKNVWKLLLPCYENFPIFFILLFNLAQKLSKIDVLEICVFGLGYALRLNLEKELLSFFEIKIISHFVLCLEFFSEITWHLHVVMKFLRLPFTGYLVPWKSWILIWV